MAGPDAPETPDRASKTLLAACGNCVAWRAADAADADAAPLPDGGACAKGLAPGEGEPRCDAYEATPAFQQLIISQMMKDTHAIPIPLPGELARKARQRRRG